jgi:N-acetylmuramoyl-L-alanine amidase
MGDQTMIRIFAHLCIMVVTTAYIFSRSPQPNPYYVEEVEYTVVEPAPVVLPAREIFVLPEAEQECLALNIYFEARNQSSFGQIAVTMVVLNRVKDEFWPDTICGVVKQGSYISGRVGRNNCQFSWFCDGLSDRPKNREMWEHSNHVASVAYGLWMDGYDIVEGATNYHSNKVNPVWIKDRGMTYVATIDDHHFYNWFRYGVVYN